MLHMISFLCAFFTRLDMFLIIWRFKNDHIYWSVSAFFQIFHFISLLEKVWILGIRILSHMTKWKQLTVDCSWRVQTTWFLIFSLIKYICLSLYYLFYTNNKINKIVNLLYHVGVWNNILKNIVKNSNDIFLLSDKTSEGNFVLLQKYNFNGSWLYIIY